MAVTTVPIRKSFSLRGIFGRKKKPVISEPEIVTLPESPPDDREWRALQNLLTFEQLLKSGRATLFTEYIRRLQAVPIEITSTVIVYCGVYRVENARSPQPEHMQLPRIECLSGNSQRWLDLVNAALSKGKPPWKRIHSRSLDPGLQVIARKLAADPDWTPLPLSEILTRAFSDEYLPLVTAMMEFQREQPPSRQAVLEELLDLLAEIPVIGNSQIEA